MPGLVPLNSVALSHLHMENQGLNGLSGEQPLDLSKKDVVKFVNNTHSVNDSSVGNGLYKVEKAIKHRQDNTTTTTEDTEETPLVIDEPTEEKAVMESRQHSVNETMSKVKKEQEKEII